MSSLPYPSLVYVTAMWCGHCKVLKASGTIAKTKQRLRGTGIPVFALDENREFAKQLCVKGYPTILIFDANGKKTEYNGERSADAIVAAVCKKLGKGNPNPEKTLDQKIAIVRSFMHPGDDTNRTVSIPVLIAASIEEAEDILDALEDDIQQLPDTIGLRAFNNVLFVDRLKEM